MLDLKMLLVGKYSGPVFEKFTILNILPVLSCVLLPNCPLRKETKYFLCLQPKLDRRNITKIKHLRLLKVILFTMLI